MGEIHRIREKRSCCAFECQNQHAKKDLSYFLQNSVEKTPFETECRRLCLQAIKQTDWTDETCYDLPTIRLLSNIKTHNLSHR